MAIAGGGIDLDMTLLDTFIRETGDQPWCMVVGSNQAHTPWTRGDPTVYDADSLTLPPYLIDTPVTRENLTRYYAEITYMDNQVKQCLEYLDTHEKSDNTLVIYLSEQGSNFPHCKWTCYDTGLRSAAVVRWPGIVRPGRETEAMIQYIDVLPTFIEAAGGNPLDFDFDGKSFLRVLKGETDNHHEYSFGVQTSKGIYSGPEPDGYGIRTARDKRYRFVWNLNWEQKFSNTVIARMDAYHSWKAKGEQGDAFAMERFEHYQRRPEYELYDLQADPYELENLADSPDYQKIQERLKAQVVAWMKQQSDQGKLTEFDALSRKGVHDTRPSNVKPLIQCSLPSYRSHLILPKFPFLCYSNETANESQTLPQWLGLQSSSADARVIQNADCVGCFLIRPGETNGLHRHLPRISSGRLFP